MRIALLPLFLILAACGREAPSGEAEAPAPPATAAEHYSAQIVGRWGETADCAGAVWTFAPAALVMPGGVSAPGQVTCPVLSVGEGADGPGGAVRLIASGCESGPRFHGDVAADLRLEDGALTIAGVYMDLPAGPWRRCAAQ